MDEGVRAMLRVRFPKVRIVQGRCGTGGEPQTGELREAFEQAEFMLHGSGPSIVGQQALTAWRAFTGKPYGVYGVTTQDVNPELADLLSGAEFIFTRETHSLKKLEAAKVFRPLKAFGPDGTFAIDVLDEARATTFLKDSGLVEGEFICVVPRLRYTPYHKIRKVNWSEEEIARKEQHNARYAEQDHAKFREVIVRWVRDTGRKVLICPEMTYQLDIIGPLLVDPLPHDVLPHVVARKTYWGPDEAASVY